MPVPTFMSKSADHSAAYLRFLNLVEAIRDIPEFPGLDIFEERLLNVFATAWHTGQNITVRQAMTLDIDMSESTIHRRLKSLRKKGYLVLVVDDEDNRVKYVRPTPVCNKYFAALGRCLSKARPA